MHRATCSLSCSHKVEQTCIVQHTPCRTHVHTHVMAHICHDVMAHAGQCVSSQQLVIALLEFGKNKCLQRSFERQHARRRSPRPDVVVVVVLVRVPALLCEQRHLTHKASPAKTAIFANYAKGRESRERQIADT